MDASDALEQLYAVEPEEFVAERKRLERSLRDEGRSEEANEVAALRKPSAPVFAANRLARQHRDDVAELIAAGEQLAAAQERGDADALRKAQRALSEHVSRLVRHAELSDAMEQRLAVLLRAAATDPESAASLRRGVLSDEVEPAAFDAVLGMKVAAPKRRAAPKRTRDEATDRRRRERVEQLEDQLSAARSELRSAERKLGEAERERERAARLIDQLTERLENARRAV
jgi:hypothetical protein